MQDDRHETFRSQPATWPWPSTVRPHVCEPWCASSGALAVVVLLLSGILSLLLLHLGDASDIIAVSQSRVEPRAWCSAGSQSVTYFCASRGGADLHALRFHGESHGTCSQLALHACIDSRSHLLMHNAERCQ